MGAQCSEDAAQRRVDGLVACYERGPGANLASSRGTLWGAVNACTFYVDHAIRSQSSSNRLNSAWFGIKPGIDRKYMLWKVLSQIQDHKKGEVQMEVL